LKKIIFFILVSTSLFAQSDWYLGNTCESIKEFKMRSPLDLVSKYGCKPNKNKYLEEASDIGLLSFDCTHSELKGYMNLIFGKENCLEIKKLTEKRMERNNGVF